MSQWKLYKRPRNPFYQARRSVNGIKERVSTGLSDKKAAELLITRWNRESADPAYAASATKTLGKVVQAYLDEREDELSLDTMTYYGEKLGHPLRILGIEVALAHISREMMADYIVDRLTDRVCDAHSTAGARDSACSNSASGVARP